jgi:hypothetical protein
MSYLSTLAAASGMLPGRISPPVDSIRNFSMSNLVEEVAIEQVAPTPPRPPADPPPQPLPRLVLQDGPDPVQPAPFPAPEAIEIHEMAPIRHDTSTSTDNPVISPPRSIAPQPAIEIMGTGKNDQAPLSTPVPSPAGPTLDIVRAWVAAGPDQSGNQPPESDHVTPHVRFQPDVSAPRQNPVPVTIDLEPLREDPPTATTSHLPASHQPAVHEQQVTVSIGEIELTIDTPPLPAPPVWKSQPVESGNPFATDVAQRLRRRYINTGEPY